MLSLSLYTFDRATIHDWVLLVALKRDTQFLFKLDTFIERDLQVNPFLLTNHVYKMSEASSTLLSIDNSKIELDAG